jgi:RND family efflux transporter MFP subunit
MIGQSSRFTPSTRQASWLALLLLAGCHGSSTPDATPARSVRVATLETTVLTEDIRAVGFLAPQDEAKLSFKLGGVIEAVPVEEGQTIRRGQLLARLRSTEVEAAVAQAREGAAKTKRDLERGQQLFADGVATRENLDDLNSAASVAAAQLRSVEFNASYARITAPADGMVLQKLAERDELVGPGQTVVVVGGTRQGWVVRVSVADREVVQLRPGLAAKLHFDAFPTRDFAGVIRTVARSADPATGSFQVEIAVQDAAPGFGRGMVATALLPRVADNALPPAMVLPNSALLEANGDRATVMAVVGDRVQRHDVHLGRIVGDRVEVLDGLKPGDQVVVEGASFVAAGDRVTVKR